ncbi:MAG: dihydrofolate reductase [Bacteroidota bacterium]
MIISLIAAKAINNAIGKDNRLLWHLPEDLKFFKQKTMGHHMLMGRKTYESLGKKLKGRTILVLTSNKDYPADENVIVVESIQQAIDYARERNETELFIGGGETIYTQAMPVADCMYITQVDASFPGDTFFPTIEASQWEVKEEKHHPQDSANAYSFTIIEYCRKEN